MALSRGERKQSYMILGHVRGVYLLSCLTCCAVGKRKIDSVDEDRGARSEVSKLRRLLADHAPFLSRSLSPFDCALDLEIASENGLDGVLGGGPDGLIRHPDDFGSHSGYLVCRGRDDP